MIFLFQDDVDFEQYLKSQSKEKIEKNVSFENTNSEQS